MSDIIKTVDADRNAEHLRLLSIFHYVLAGMLTFVSMFPLIHLAVGIGLVTGAFDESAQGPKPPEFLGWILIGIASVVIICGLTLAISVAIAGRRLMQRRSYTFCQVIAAIECLFMPLGTALGICSIIVLMRPAVKQQFDVA